jgi:hypothetical protein
MRRPAVLVVCLGVLPSALAGGCRINETGGAWGVRNPNPECPDSGGDCGAPSHEGNDGGGDERADVELDVGVADSPDATQPSSVCPPETDVQANTACGVLQNLSCKSSTNAYDCNGQVAGFVPCNCVAGAWACAPTSACFDARPPCPPSTLVQSNAACTSPEYLQCKSEMHTYDCSGQVDGYVSCSCVSGSWLCTPSSTCADGGGD